MKFIKFFFWFSLLIPCIATASWFDDSFNPNDSPPAPDYSNPASWAALPDRENTTQHTPAQSLVNNQATATADVFYIHPTTFLSEWAWNGDVKNKKLNQETENTYVKWQATPFNSIAKIYAPHYRQATLYAFVPESEGGPPAKDSQQALDLAYSDVEQAFDYYMQHYNHGRPLFIVSHSQGSYLAIRLLQHKYRQYHLNRILVAAYLVGESIGKNTFDDLPVCATPTQTNCFVTWASVLNGAKPQLVTGTSPGGAICVNPLTFSLKQPNASAQENLGGVPKRFDHIDPAVVSARCQNGVLWISKPASSDYQSYENDYHESDFNLFYMNIRQNAEVRLEAFRQ